MRIVATLAGKTNDWIIGSVVNVFSSSVRHAERNCACNVTLDSLSSFAARI